MDVYWDLQVLFQIFLGNQSVNLRNLEGSKLLNCKM
jgi:hypothetical protein